MNTHTQAHSEKSTKERDFFVNSTLQHCPVNTFTAYYYQDGGDASVFLPAEGVAAYVIVSQAALEKLRPGERVCVEMGNAGPYAYLTEDLLSLSIATLWNAAKVTK